MLKTPHIVKKVVSETEKFIMWCQLMAFMINGYYGWDFLYAYVAVCD